MRVFTSLSVGAVVAAALSLVAAAAISEGSFSSPSSLSSSSSSSSLSSSSQNVLWVKQITPMTGGAVLTDVHAIPTPDGKGVLAYAAGELGLLIKLNETSTASPLNSTAWRYLSIPDSSSTYNYGVFAFPDQHTVLTTGFVDDSTDTKGFFLYSHDGGNTFDPRVELETLEWCGGPIMMSANQKEMIVPSVAGAKIWINTEGTLLNATAFVEVQPDPAGAWHSGDYLYNSTTGYIKIVGASDCTSTDFGAQWTCVTPVDADADGGISCGTSSGSSVTTYCAIGGGEISPADAGWVHVSKDGGKTYDKRVLSSPFPIRTVEVIGYTSASKRNSLPLMIAAGGNYFGDIGGIYSSLDGGSTWTQDLNTNGEEVKACRGLEIQQGAVFRLFCVTAGPSSSSVFATDITL